MAQEFVPKTSLVGEPVGALEVLRRPVHESPVTVCSCVIRKRCEEVRQFPQRFLLREVFVSLFELQVRLFVDPLVGVDAR
jgi:hypothetical protein